MRNGELDSKGALASIIKSQGTMESFKVSSSLFFQQNSYLFRESGMIMTIHIEMETAYDKIMKRKLIKKML